MNVKAPTYSVMLMLFFTWWCIRIVYVKFVKVPKRLKIILDSQCSLRHRSQSQTGKSKRSTCHRWWCAGRTPEWLSHPWGRHWGSFLNCCTWDCRSLQTSPEHAPLAHQTRSRSWGCHSGLGWLQLPPATMTVKNMDADLSCQENTTSKTFRFGPTYAP